MKQFSVMFGTRLYVNAKTAISKVFLNKFIKPIV